MKPCKRDTVHHSNPIWQLATADDAYGRMQGKLMNAHDDERLSDLLS